MEIINNPNEVGNDQKETTSQKVERLRTQGYEVNISGYISEAFAIFKKDAGSFIGYTLVFIAISVGLGLIPIIGQIASAIISPALVIGYAVVSQRIRKGEAYGFNNFFDGFQKVFPLFLGQFVSGILVVIGMVLLIIPGIYLAVGYVFVTLFIWFTKEDFWESMELSRKLVTKKWFSFFGFVIVLGLINILGAIALGVGLLVSVPVTIIAIYLAFSDIVGIEE